MALMVSFGRPYTRRICSIFPLWMASKALVKSTSNIVACRFFARTPSRILRIVNICEVVDLFLRKPRWFFLRILSILGSMRLRNRALYILAAIDVSIIPRWMNSEEYAIFFLIHPFKFNTSWHCIKISEILLLSLNEKAENIFMMIWIRWTWPFLIALYPFWSAILILLQSISNENVLYLVVSILSLTYIQQIRNLTYCRQPNKNFVFEP